MIRPTNSVRTPMTMVIDMRPLAVVAMLALSACSTIDRYGASELTPGAEPGVWTYRAYARLDAPEDDPAAERTRLEWLHQWMVDANACPAGKGYEIEGRHAVPQSTIFGATIHTLYYTVRCRPAATP